MKMSEIKSIKRQWVKPVHWSIETEDTKINVLDEEQSCVASSIVHSHVKSCIEEHIQKVQTAIVMDLLLSTSDEPEA
jgi:hypothetical protein|tara:strand:- start:743 stop:973 length:231 start_codon:yes stop_codon:yes gene_type:complete